jgi:hypothetical protein
VSTAAGGCAFAVAGIGGMMDRMELCTLFLDFNSYFAFNFIPDADE